MESGCWNAVSILLRAGSDVRPPTWIPATETPSGMARVGVDAGAAAHARPAAAQSAASVLSTAPNYSTFQGLFANAVRSAPYRRRHGVRQLADRSLCLRGGPRARPRARRLRDDGVRSRPARLCGHRRSAALPGRGATRARPVL